MARGSTDLTTRLPQQVTLLNSAAVQSRKNFVSSNKEPGMGYDRDHISVCVCTYQRPEMLANLLAHLGNQETGQLFSYSIVVSDNDHNQSGKHVVDRFRQTSGVGTEYSVEPTRNIALARNKALENATGSLIAWIDDDEFPGDRWLLNLYRALRQYQADGVLGPVRPSFEKDPPEWVIRGRFYEKGRHETGAVLKWQDTRTSNVLIRRAIITSRGDMFDPRFGRGGEDVDFFTRMIRKNHVFVWCNEAPVLETIPPERCRRLFMLKRALLRGRGSLQYSSFGWGYVLKSVLAVPGYALILPLAFLVGHHHFMDVLIRLSEHLGRLLALCGFDVVKEYYLMK